MSTPRPPARVRRGWIRRALLGLLTERSMYGYEMISELAERSGGTWRPSPGSVYPTLQTLEAEGLVSVRAEAGKRQFTLTDAGRETATAVGATAVWNDGQARSDAPDPSASDPLRAAVGELVVALDQVLVVGTATQKDRAVDLLARTRRGVYAILAEPD